MMSKMLYHYTSSFGLSGILNAGYIAVFNNALENNSGVVWLTSSSEPENHGLKYYDDMPAEFDKTSIRLSVPHKPTFENWDAWSVKKGMDKTLKQILIETAAAEETYLTWYISENEIPLSDVIKIENIKTGETIDIEKAKKSLPLAHDLPEPKIADTDRYILNQPSNIQVLLLEVRQAIREALPDAVEKISWQMPTFWKKRNLIHFAAQKNHLGIYPGAAAIEYFAPKLTGYKTSKGAVQFPYKSFGKEQLKLISEIAAWCGMENTDNG